MREWEFRSVDTGNHLLYKSIHYIPRHRISVILYKLNDKIINKKSYYYC